MIESDVEKSAHMNIKKQKPVCVWFTGLPGSGKTTLARALSAHLSKHTIQHYLLDGDEIRAGLNRDLNFSDADRAENIRRAGEVARLMMKKGMVVIAAFVSPSKQARAEVRNLFSDGEFFEVFVDAPVAVCEARDPKGLYAKARKGEIVNFTGIDGHYEEPTNPDLHLYTQRESVETCVEKIVQTLFPSFHV